MGSRGTSRGRRTAAAMTLGFFLCTLASAPAAAQGAAKDPTSSADKARAEELFKKSVESYRTGDFKQAIELLDAAYAIDPQPVLIYNRARAEEGLGRLDEAIAGYEHFLTLEPGAPDRGAIEQRLTTLRRQRDERAALEKERESRAQAPAAAPASSAGTGHEPSQSARSPNVLPYVVAGAGVAGVAAGAIFGVLAVSRKDDAVAEPVQQKAIDLKDDADGLATLSTVGFIVGGILVAAGVTWWVLDRQSSSKQGATSVRLRLGAGLVGIGGFLP
jgi:tetratricopeptide (TPR) repeat protein